jgi:hypothetical protein
MGRGCVRTFTQRLALGLMDQWLRPPSEPKRQCTGNWAEYSDNGAFCQNDLEQLLNGEQGQVRLMSHSPVGSIETPPAGHTGQADT